MYRGFHDFDISQDEILQSEGLRAVAVLPVKNEGQVVAVLNLAPRTRDEILPGARDVVEAIAAQIGGVVARVRMEAALRQSQRNLEALFDALDDLVFVIGLDGRIIHANFQVRMRLGYSLPEIVGQPVTDLHPPDRRQEAADIFARMLAGQTSLCPVPVLAKDGTLLEVETKISRGEWDGRPALFGISRDMSERIRTEHLLRTENAFREAVIDGVAEGLCVCRDISEFPHLRFTVWNHRMTEITGYTLEQINRSGWYETLYPDESRREAIRADAAAFQEGREYRGAEWVITRADGEHRTLLVWTSRLDTGQRPKHLLALVQDVTEKNRLQQPLRDSQDKLAAVLAAVTDHISMLDEEHNIVWVNGVAERLFGSDLVGRKCHRVFHGRNEPCENCLVRRTFASGRPQEHETRVLTLEGERAYWCTSSVAARHDDGRPRLVIEVSRDITDRQRAEELSRKHLAELARVARLATMGEMASGLAHEINQPLAAVASYAGACFHTLDKSPSPPKEQLRDLLTGSKSRRSGPGRLSTA